MKHCSFTGHRDIPKKHETALIGLLRRGIQYVYDEGVRHFYIGGALGFDTLAAKEIVLFRFSHPDIMMHLVLPCLDQTDRWSDRQRDMYEYLLSEADTVEYIADGYYKGCMRDRNVRLVEQCDCLIAYVGRAVGGAAQTKRLAERSGKPVYNLYYEADRASST